MRVLRLVLLLALILVLGSRVSHAQQTVSGRVRDYAGAPVFGATVSNGHAQVRTDRDGAFAIVDATGVLDVSARGLASARVRLVAGQAVEVVLGPAALRHDERVVVTAQRQDADPFVVPGSVSVVTRRDLEERLPRTTPDALAETAGVFMQKTNHGGGSPYLRGLVGNQVLILVDGVRLNNATYRLGPNQYLNTIDPATIERIEVVRGHGAVLYGTDAMGGVVHVITRTPTPRGGDWFLDARSVVKGATGTPEQSARVELEGGRGSFAWGGGVSVRAFGDLRAGGDLGVRAPSAYDEADLDLKGHWAPGPGRRLTVSLQQTRQENVGRFDQVAQRGFASWAFDPQQRSLASATYRQQVGRAGVESLVATVAVQRLLEERRSRRAGSPVEAVERDVVRVGSGGLVASWRPLGGWRVISGIDVTTDAVDSGRTDTNQLTGQSRALRGLYADDASARSVAVYALGQREIGRAHVEAGARYASHVVRASAPTFGAFTLDADAVVAQAGVSVPLTEGLRSFVSVWQGFRAPNVDDVSALGGFDFGIETPTQTLQPESSLAVEGGAKWRSATWSASASVYRLDLRDLIERVRGAWLGQATYEGQNVWVRDNVGRARVHGLEVETQVALTPSVQLRAWLTHTHGQEITRAEPMRRIPPVHGLLGLAWRPASGTRWAELVWRGAGRQDRLASGDRADHRIDPNGTASWHTLTMRGGWRLATGVELVAAIENSLDQPYRIHGSGIDGAGRTAWVGAHVRLF